jgi:hypothetical protein
VRLTASSRSPREIVRRGPLSLFNVVSPLGMAVDRVHAQADYVRHGVARRASFARVWPNSLWDCDATSMSRRRSSSHRSKHKLR